MKPLTWTSEPPTAAGFYWYRGDDWTEKAGQVVEVYFEDDADALDGEPPHWRATWGTWWELADTPAGLEWAGPIPPPQEPAP